MLTWLKRVDTFLKSMGKQSSAPGAKVALLKEKREFENLVVKIAMERSLKKERQRSKYLESAVWRPR